MTKDLKKAVSVSNNVRVGKICEPVMQVSCMRESIDTIRDIIVTGFIGEFKTVRSRLLWLIKNINRHEMKIKRIYLGSTITAVVSVTECADVCVKIKYQELFKKDTTQKIYGALTTGSKKIKTVIFKYSDKDSTIVAQFSIGENIRLM